ncbi:hypothetical protein DSUL_100184 [Desulfovibrionales bacterium]
MNDSKINMTISETVNNNIESRSIWPRRTPPEMEYALLIVAAFLCQTAL